MISPGEQLTPALFENLKREIERRGRIWVWPGLSSSNVNPGVMLRAIAGPGAPPIATSTVLTARLQLAVNPPILDHSGFPMTDEHGDIITDPTTLAYDWDEVVYDPVRADFVPKPGGRRSFIINDEVTPPNGDHAAYELNNAPLTGPTGQPPLYPINQVVVLNPAVDSHGNPTGFYWFDYDQPRDRNLFALDRGQGGDCAWVGAQDTSVANSACSPVGYRFGSAYGQPSGLFQIPDNPCDLLGPLLGGCTTPNDGTHGDGVAYHNCCANPLPETLFLTVPAGEVSGSFSDTIPPGTYQFDFVLADGFWESTAAITNAIRPPNDTAKVFFAGIFGCTIAPDPTAGGGFALFTAPAQVIFISCDPFMVTIEWSGVGGLQHLTLSL